jgi:hypothetical protein
MQTPPRDSREVHQGRHGSNIVILLSFCAALAGCATTPVPERRPIAWDGLGVDSNRAPITRRHVARSAAAESDANVEREKVLATLRPYSRAWWAVQDEIEAENDRQLGSRLVICRRCVPSAPPSEDVTGSIQ